VTGLTPGAGPVAGPRYLLLWNIDPLGECCCRKGTVRSREDVAVAGPGSCERRGKHPWTMRLDGQLVGFRQGVSDAVVFEDLERVYGYRGPGARRMGMSLRDVLVFDIDNQRALWDFVRLTWSFGMDRILGVATSPRGWHVYLALDGGWNQRALNLKMAGWLADQGRWSSGDVSKVGFRGFCVDVRTGENRFVVWPDGRERKWVGLDVFGAMVGRMRRELPSWRRVADADGAPWNLKIGPELGSWLAEQANYGQVDVSFLGEVTDAEFLMLDLEEASDRLAELSEGSRNNRLNSLAFHLGSKVVWAGASVEDVKAVLRSARCARGWTRAKPKAPSDPDSGPGWQVFRIR
jgi:hypothetical protein